MEELQRSVFPVQLVNFDQFNLQARVETSIVYSNSICLSILHLQDNSESGVGSDYHPQLWFQLVANPHLVPVVQGGMQWFAKSWLGICIADPNS